MSLIEARIEPTYDAWRAQARTLLRHGIHPDRVVWSDGRGDQELLPALTTPAPAPAAAAAGRLSVPRRFVERARLAARHSTGTTWDVLYRVLWRIVHEDRTLVQRELDPDVAALLTLARQVEEDVERLKAFARFRKVDAEDGSRFVAWYQPDHDVAALAGEHFAARYPTGRWSILTQYRSVHVDDGAVTEGPGVPRDAAPSEAADSAAEDLWRTYYASAFNPARANRAKLSRDLPARVRPTLPEAALIEPLLKDARARSESLREASGGVTMRAVVPDTGALPVVRDAAAGCRACPLHLAATGTVFGEGPAAASLMLIGEQPGDVEDRLGRPFVGPAGEVLDRALAEAGLDRRTIYLTNAVKHFAFEPRGKRRIHRTPRLSEIRACRPWLEAELASIRPRVVVCLGATAAQTLLGPQARVNALRGHTITTNAFAPAVLVTLHPSAVLRAEDDTTREAYFHSLVADLRRAHAIVTG